MKFKLNYVCLALFAATGTASAMTLTDAGPANTRTPGFTAPNNLSRELAVVLQANGSNSLDCATSTDNGDTFTTQFNGYLDNPANVAPIPNTMVPVFVSLSVPVAATQATKTEPDKNTYLFLNNIEQPQHGCSFQPDGITPYDYGTHFLFQGHEAGAHGYITRVNLDADGAHRVTLLADTMVDYDNTIKKIPNLDGSTWNPFTQKLMFTGEEYTSGGDQGIVVEATPDYPSTVKSLANVIGYDGWEGIQVDSQGNLWLISDVGGANGTGTYSKAKRPNSFVYRFTPSDTINHDPSLGGKLEALQVYLGPSPIIFNSLQNADQAINSSEMLQLHTCGNGSFNTKWVTVHDTAVDVSGLPFDANALAKANGATPFKRPENGVFRPGSSFKDFYFTETGDTNEGSAANSDLGGWGGVYKLSQVDTDADGIFDAGLLTMIVEGDKYHTGLDNIQFLDKTDVLVGEDAGDTLHKQRNALDSVYKYDVTKRYCKFDQNPVIRFLAEGRDASATLDVGVTETLTSAGIGDNETTGIHVSNGDPTVTGLLGVKLPAPFRGNPKWRVFWTQQHGDNNIWETIKK